jgi:uncharacterized membrane protein YeaQ/YmgE (transglycosylase-associated protein family)
MDYFALMVTGVVVGWLAGQFMQGKGFGMNIDIIAGVIGALIGGALSERTGIMAGSGLVGNLILGVTGALAILYATRMFSKV